MFHTCLYLGLHSHLDLENQFKQFVPGSLVKCGFTLMDPHSRASHKYTYAVSGFYHHHSMPKQSNLKISQPTHPGQKQTTAITITQNLQTSSFHVPYHAPRTLMLLSWIRFVRCGTLGGVSNSAMDAMQFFELTFGKSTLENYHGTQNNLLAKEKH